MKRSGGRVRAQAALSATATPKQRQLRHHFLSPPPTARAATHQHHQPHKRTHTTRPRPAINPITSSTSTTWPTAHRSVAAAVAVAARNSSSLESRAGKHLPSPPLRPALTPTSKTGLAIADNGARNEHGMEELDAFFQSSPAKSLANGAALSDTDEPTTSPVIELTRNTHIEQTVTETSMDVASCMCFLG